MKESVLIVIGNGIVGSERSVESPDCLLLSVILKLLLPSKMYFGKKKKKNCLYWELVCKPTDMVQGERNTQHLPLHLSSPQYPH